jgi:hypothetical protein
MKRVERYHPVDAPSQLLIGRTRVLSERRKVIVEGFAALLTVRRHDVVVSGLFPVGFFRAKGAGVQDTLLHDLDGLFSIHTSAVHLAHVDSADCGDCLDSHIILGGKGNVGTGCADAEGPDAILVDITSRAYIGDGRLNVFGALPGIFQTSGLPFRFTLIRSVKD